MKQLITSTGFCNTGSSAITHLLSEFDSVENISGVYEVRLLYDPDCISDLEYNLVDNPHRYGTSFAITRFIEYIKFNSNPLLNHHYESLCGGKFRECSMEYVKDISLFDFDAVSHIDTWHKGKFCWFINRIYMKIVMVLFRQKFTKIIPSTIVRKQKQYAGVCNRSQFLNATHKYTNRLLDYLRKGKDIVLVDQLFPATNIARYRDYISQDYDVKVFIVDRDPRDLYVMFKKLLHTTGVPCYDIKIFCEWIKWTREQSHQYSDPLYVKRIQFEDLIYDYEKTREGIVDFCGFNNFACSQKGKIFRPELSINNTQSWYRFPELSDDIKYIEETLPQYCYNFNEKSMKPDFINGKMFDC